MWIFGGFCCKCSSGSEGTWIHEPWSWSSQGNQTHLLNISESHYYSDWQELLAHFLPKPNLTLFIFSQKNWWISKLIWIRSSLFFFLIVGIWVFLQNFGGFRGRNGISGLQPQWEGPPHPHFPLAHPNPWIKHPKCFFFRSDHNKSWCSHRMGLARGVSLLSNQQQNPLIPLNVQERFGSLTNDKGIARVFS